MKICELWISLRKKLLLFLMETTTCLPFFFLLHLFMVCGYWQAPLPVEAPSWSFVWLSVLFFKWFMYVEIWSACLFLQLVYVQYPESPAEGLKLQMVVSCRDAWNQGPLKRGLVFLPEPSVRLVWLSFETRSCWVLSGLELPMILPCLTRAWITGLYHHCPWLICLPLFLRCDFLFFPHILLRLYIVS